jgi:hypothetical protein
MCMGHGECAGGRRRCIGGNWRWDGVCGSWVSSGARTGGCIRKTAKILIMSEVLEY